MPRIGLLSDSHGRAETTRRAVDLLVSHGADILLHLGDVGSVEVIDALAVPAASGSGQLEAHLVFGNTDWDHRELALYAQDLGIGVDHPVGQLALPEGTLVFCHGHEASALAAALDQRVRYLCHGHTHRAEDQRRGATRVLNPGALFRADQYTVALLDTAQDRVDFLVVPGA